MDTVKTSVGFPFSCAQCHCRTRQDLIKDQKNNTVIEKRLLRHTNSHTPVTTVYLKKHATTYFIQTLRIRPHRKRAAAAGSYLYPRRAGICARGGQESVPAVGRNLCPRRAAICARGGQRSVPAAGSDLCPRRAAICAHGGQRPVPVAVRLSKCII